MPKKKKLQAEKTSLCVVASAHCTLHFLDFIDESKLYVYVAFFRGPGECPAVATVTSASCLLLLRLAFLPRPPSPADPATKAVSHGRQGEGAATFFADDTFPRVCMCSCSSDKVANAKITKKTFDPPLTEEEKVFFFSYLDGRHGTESSGSLAF